MPVDERSDTARVMEDPPTSGSDSRLREEASAHKARDPAGVVLVMAELRSERVQEIMGHVPTWTIRYGITVIFGAILLLLLLAWMIRLPPSM